MRWPDLWLYSQRTATVDDRLFLYFAALTSMASPILLLKVITGVLLKKTHQEIPGYIKCFWLGPYVMLIVIPFVIQL